LVLIVIYGIQPLAVLWLHGGAQLKDCFDMMIKEFHL